MAERLVRLLDVVVYPFFDRAKPACEFVQATRTSQPSSESSTARKPGWKRVKVNLRGGVASLRNQVHGIGPEHEILVVPGLAAASHHEGHGALGAGGVIHFDADHLIRNAGTGQRDVVAGASGLSGRCLNACTGDGVASGGAQLVGRRGTGKARARNGHRLRTAGSTVRNTQRGGARSGRRGPASDVDGAIAARAQAAAVVGLRKV